MEVLLCPPISRRAAALGDLVSTIDTAVLVVYVAGVVAFGCYFVRRSRSTEGFTAAGRSLPGWAVGLSILGTYVSSISFLAVPGKAWKGNWNSFVFSMSLPIAAWIAVRFFVPLYRKRGDVSAYSYLEARFGAWARSYAGICYMLTQLARVGSIMFLVALALSELLHWPVEAIIIGTGILVTLYTLLGGIEAVIWTDVVQSIILVGGALISAVVLLFGMPEGPGQLFSVACAEGKFSLGSFGASYSEPTFWVVLIYGLVMNLQNFGIDQSYVQRYATAKSDGDAQKSVWLGALAYIPVSALFFFIGTALFAYYQAHPGALPVELQNTAEPERIYAHFIVTQLPVGLTGLLIAAVFAAAMSTVDSSLNSSATLVLTDFYRRYWRKDADEKASMRVLYGATLAFGLLGTGAALLLAAFEKESVLDVWWQLSGIFGGGMLGLFLLGVISRSARNVPAAIAVVVGVAVIGWMVLSPVLAPEGAKWSSPFHGFLVCVIGTAVIFLVGFLLSLLWANGRRRS